MICTYAKKPMKTFDITDVRITPVTPRNGLVAFASFKLNGSLYLGSVALHEKLDGSGLRLTYPMKGERNVFHPLTPELSKAIEQVVFEEYQKL